MTIAPARVDSRGGSLHHAGMEPNGAPRAAAARLGGIDCWIFDLDNTLYPVESDLFGQIDVRMSEFIAAEIGIGKAAARRLQKNYFHDYGTTLRGLMIEHGVEPQAYLDYVHDIDHSVLAPAPLLSEALAALPGRKLVFTNGSANHAERVLARLGVADRFEAVFDIAAAEYEPKPFDPAYDRMMTRHRVRGESAVFFEDSLANLAPAAARGMTTAWLRNGRGDSPGVERVDHVIGRLDRWLAGVAGALAEAPREGEQGGDDDAG